jgi:hypothetical protein
MSKRQRNVVALVLAFGFLSAILDWFGWFRNGGWYPTDQRRIVPTVDG